MLTGSMTYAIIWGQIKRIHWKLEQSVFFLIIFGLRTLENSHLLFCVTGCFHLPQYISNCEENGKR